jgi:hypothetical protein
VSNDKLELLKSSMIKAKEKVLSTGYPCLLEILLNRETSIMCKEVITQKTFFLPKKVLLKVDFNSINKAMLVSIPEFLAKQKKLI